MNVLISILIVVALTICMFIIAEVIYYLLIFIHYVLRKTILKKYEYNKTLNKVKYKLGYNQQMILLYKGEIKELPELYKNETRICYCFKEWDYPKKLGIDEKLLQEGVKSQKECLRLSRIYYENKRQEDIKSRVEFLEKELKDIKERM